MMVSLDTIEETIAHINIKTETLSRYHKELYYKLQQSKHDYIIRETNCHHCNESVKAKHMLENYLSEHHSGACVPGSSLHLQHRILWLFSSLSSLDIAMHIGENPFQNGTL